MSTKKLFAVDFGASGGKCFSGIFEGDHFTMREVHRFAHEGVSFFAGDKSGRLTERTVWNDIYLYDNVLKGLRAYRRDVSDSLDSVGIDTWGADGQFVSADGDMLGKIYCYRDHRLDGTIDVIRSKVDARRIYEITGIHFQPFNLSNQLHWFMENRKDMLRPGCVFLPIPTVFYYYLGGVKKVDSSWASVTQLMDARKKKWSKEILDQLGIPMGVMPEIVEPGTVVGELLEPIARMTGLNQAKLIAVGSHDTASAFAAAPVENYDEALIISSGTWSLVGKLVPEPVTSDIAMKYNFSNEGGIGNIRLLKNCMGTWIVQELKRIWTAEDGRMPPWQELDMLTEGAPAFSGFIDPDYPGFYNPSNMHSAIVEFCKKTGQAVPQSRGVVLRMVYESLAMKYRTIKEQMTEVTGKEIKVVNIVGGGTKNVLLNRFSADAMGVPVIAGPEEGTAVGNFMVQAVGLGVLPDIHAAQAVIRKAFSIKQYKPQNVELWDKAYGRFKSVALGGV